MFLRRDSYAFQHVQAGGHFEKCCYWKVTRFPFSAPPAGAALIDASESMKRLAEVKDSLDIDVKQNFIDPLQGLCDKDLREIQVCRVLRTSSLEKIIQLNEVSVCKSTPEKSGRELMYYSYSKKKFFMSKKNCFLEPQKTPDGR